MEADDKVQKNKRNKKVKKQNLTKELDDSSQF